MAMRGFGSRFLRMSSRHDHMKNALAGINLHFPDVFHVVMSCHRSFSKASYSSSLLPHSLQNLRSSLLRREMRNSCAPPQKPPFFSQKADANST